MSSRVPTRTTRPSQDPYRDPYSDVDTGYPGDQNYPDERYYGTARTPGAAPSQYDLYADPTWEDAAAYESSSAPRRRPRQRSRAVKPSIGIALPAISDRTIAAIVGAAVLSLIVMIGVVWSGIGDLESIVPWHLNASGDVDGWITNSGLWRIPFGVFMSLLIGLALGAFLWKRDRFAARFIITSMCVLQILAWVAVVDQLW